MSSLTLQNLYRSCGFPQGTPSETSTWNTLADGGSATGWVKIGLFGYDISCIKEMCASLQNEDTTDSDGNFRGYCGLIESRGLDGLAFGGYWKLSSSNTVGDLYCAGFRNNSTGDRTGNTVACFDP